MRELAPSSATFVDRWFIERGGDYVESYDELNLRPEAGDNWLAWTDDPDSAYQDWENHLFMVHTRPGSTERGAPVEVARRHAWAVENLTLAKLAGSVAGKVFEHRAAHHLGIAAHYVGDMSQFGHTDDTRRDHSRPSYDPLRRTYHGYYESVTWTVSGLSALDAALRADPRPLAPVQDVAAEVEALARLTNARDGASVKYRDSNGAVVTVGSDYAWALDRFVANYDSGVRHLGMRGYDAALWDYTVESQRASVHLLARLIADADARADAALALPVSAGFAEA